MESENFKKLVRTLHLYLKFHHHLGNIKISDGSIKEPPSLHRFMGTLETQIRPACPNDHTALMLNGNARNWLHNSLQIMEDHYTTKLRETTQTLKTLSLDQWEEAWQVAIRWNKRNLKNIKESTITATTAILKNLIKDIKTGKPNSSDTAPPLQTDSVTAPEQGARTPPTPQAQTNVGSPILTLHPDPLVPSFDLQLDPDTTEAPIGSASEPLDTSEVGPQSPDTSKSDPQSPTRPLKRKKLHGPARAEKRIREEQPGTSAQTPTTDWGSLVEEQLAPLYTRHTGDKYRHFTLKPQRPFLIMGDSNLNYIPRIENALVQVDCYPGAQLAHAYHVLKHKTPVSPAVQNVLLSFGLNNRDQGNPSLLSEQLKRLITVAKATFPHATIGIPVLNYSHRFPKNTKDNIETLNFCIRQTGASIPPLPHALFDTIWDKIHWTPNTGKHMVDHWLKHLNLA